jgi:hypothetical protein
MDGFLRMISDELPRTFPHHAEPLVSAIFYTLFPYMACLTTVFFPKSWNSPKRCYYYRSSVIITAYSTRRFDGQNFHDFFFSLMQRWIHGFRLHMLPVLESHGIQRRNFPPGNTTRCPPRSLAVLLPGDPTWGTEKSLGIHAYHLSWVFLHPHHS